MDDEGNAFAPSPDPLLAELQPIVAGLEVKEGAQDMGCLKALYSRKDVFAVDLYEAGLGERIEAMAAELFAGPGAVRRTLHKYDGLPAGSGGDGVVEKVMPGASAAEVPAHFKRET